MGRSVRLRIVVAVTVVTAAISAGLLVGGATAEGSSRHSLLTRSAFARDMDALRSATVAAAARSWTTTAYTASPDTTWVTASDATTGNVLEECRECRHRHLTTSTEHYVWAPWAAETSALSAAAMRAIGVRGKHWVVEDRSSEGPTAQPPDLFVPTVDPTSPAGPAEEAVLRTRFPDGRVAWTYAWSDPAPSTMVESRTLTADAEGRLSTLSGTTSLADLVVRYGADALVVTTPQASDTVTRRAFLIGIDVVRAPAATKPAARHAAEVARSTSSHKVAALRRTLREDARAVSTFVLTVKVADIPHGARIYVVNPYGGARVGWVVTVRSGRTSVRAL